MSLKQYIERQNITAKWFNEPEIDANKIDAATKARLLERLESDLSPEALTCDGELRGAKLQAKARMLNAAVAELKALKV